MECWNNGILGEELTFAGILVEDLIEYALHFNIPVTQHLIFQPYIIPVH